MKFFTRFNPPDKVRQNFELPSLTVQSEKDNTDVHNILERFVRTGDLGYFGKGPAQKPFYGDFSKGVDFQTAMDLNARASEYFDGLPSGIRHQFGNDHREFVRFLGNPENVAKATELGFLEKLPETVKQPLEQIQETVNIEQPSHPEGTPA